MPALPDFVVIAKRFDNLTPGQKAELKRIASPEDVTAVPAFYRLFPGEHPPPWCRRVAFVIPWAPKHCPGAPPLGRQLAKGKVSEMRIFHVVRARSPNDLIQLRRLVQHIDPQLDWARFVYDIADLFKFETVVPLAFKVAAGKPTAPEREIRLKCRDVFRKTKLLERIIPSIEEVLAAGEIAPPSPPDDAVGPAIPNPESIGDVGHRA